MTWYKVRIQAVNVTKDIPVPGVGLYACNIGQCMESCLRVLSSVCDLWAKVHALVYIYIYFEGQITKSHLWM